MKGIWSRDTYVVHRDTCVAGCMFRGMRDNVRVYCVFM